MRHSFLLLLPAALVLAPAAARAQHEHHGGHTLGDVVFTVGCNAEAQKRMNTAVAMLHSFWLTEARETFESVVQADPGCGVAYWGVAITHFGNPFAGGPGEEGNRLGLEAAQQAARIGGRTPRDRAYIDAALALYKDYPTVDNRTRMRAYEAALAKLHAQDPNHTESAIFHGLWMVVTSNPSDLTFAQQKQAAAILEPLFMKQPQHPGLAHYIIHAFDSPPLAHLALNAARRYAEIAPDAPHALHMPSHTFTRLGLWDESIKTNRRSADLEKTPAAKAHPADYMVYAYLQQGRDDAAADVLREVGVNPAGPGSMGNVWIGSYNGAAMVARYTLERDDWVAAGTLAIPADQPPTVQAVTRFARALGHARQGHVEPARAEVRELERLTQALVATKDPYWPVVTGAQRMAAEAWVLHHEGRHAEALAMAQQAADREETVEKHPVTPGPLIPARELYGDLLLEHNRPADALAAYQATLAKEPNRLRTLAGAARAARLAGYNDVEQKYLAEIRKLLHPESPRRSLLLGGMQ